MTRLPHPDRNVVDRPDLPAYELNHRCAAPGCNSLRGHGHHIWRRSFGMKSWWTELSTGEVVGNRVGLCPYHHHMVTVNNARVIFEFGIFYWQYHGETSKHELGWQPPTYHELEDMIEPGKGDPNGRTIFDNVHPEEGQECPVCKRRVPHKKKETSPKTRVFSTRVPVDDAETFSELVDAAADHMGAKTKPHHVYFTLLTGLTLILQAPKEHLP